MRVASITLFDIWRFIEKYNMPTSVLIPFQEYSLLRNFQSVITAADSDGEFFWMLRTKVRPKISMDDRVVDLELEIEDLKRQYGRLP